MANLTSNFEVVDVEPTSIQLLVHRRANFQTKQKNSAARTLPV
jgi:hypothetical protein